MIKEFDPADNGRAKVIMLKGFLYKRPLYSIKGFLKIKEKQESRNVFSSCKVDHTIDQSDIFPDKSTFKKAGLIVINKFRKNLFKTALVASL